MRPDAEPTLQEYEAYRARVRADARWTEASLRRLLAVNLVGIAAVAIVSLAFIHEFRWRLLAWVPVTLAWAGLIEYSLHRFVLHGRIVWHGKLLNRQALDAHTVRHHRYFTHERMHAREDVDFSQVLMPLLNVAGFLFLLIVPSSLIVGVIAGRDAAIVHFCVFALQLWTYEALHTVYHLPPERQPRWRWIRRLANHHRAHHNPAYMNRVGFGLTSGWLYDVVFSSTASRRRG